MSTAAHGGVDITAGRASAERIAVGVGSIGILRP